eukprot:gene4902-7571_t
MGFLDVFLFVLGPYFRVIELPSDTETQRIRKHVFPPILVAILGTAVFVAVVGTAAGGWSFVPSALWAIFVSAAALVYLAARKEVTWQFIAFVLFSSMLVGATADFPAAAKSRFRSWPFFILATDIVPLCKAPHEVAYGLIAVALTWMLTLQLESIFRFGLFDVNYWGLNDDYRAAICSCAEPPCKVPLFEGLIEWSQCVIVVCLNFLFVRTYAVQADQEQERMKMSIGAARDISRLLVRFDLSEAEASLAASEGTVPPEFHGVLLQLLSNLRLYEPFLPQSCLSHNRETASEEDDDNFMAVTPSEHSTISTSPNLEKSGRFDGSSSSTMQGTSIINSPAPPAKWEMVRKTVTVLCMNVRGSLALAAKDARPRAFEDMQRSLLLVALRAVGETKGIVESFMGDRIAASWNASRGCVLQRALAVDAACKITQSFSSASKLRLHCGVACGDALCGNTGTDNLMRYNIVGGVYPYAHDLMQVGLGWGLEIVTDSRVQKDVAESHRAQVILERVLFTKRSARDPVVLWQILDSYAVADEEWMYVVESDDRKLESAVHELAIAFVENRLAAVVTLRQAIEHDYCLGRGNDQSYYARVIGCIDSGVQLPVVRVPYHLPPTFSDASDGK